MKLFIYSLTICSFFALNHGFFGKTFKKFQDLVKKQRRQHFLQNGIGEVEGYAFDQRVDHFEVRIKPRTFEQRYWRNKVYWRQPNGPVFLYVGGEAGLDGTEIYGGHIVEMAKYYGALLFSVEHRFYGRSVFDGCFKRRNLNLLSSEQALADLAVFMDYAKVKFGLSNNIKWFAYGGSYPGSLAAWLRIKYPHLVFGAVASSAPVKALVNFEDYNNVVKASLSSQMVGGSNQCAANIKAAFEKMESLVDDKSFTKLKADFKSCNSISNVNDTWLFFLNIASFIMGVVQYNEQVPGLEISSLCKYMTNSSRTPYDNMAQIYRDYAHLNHIPCFDNSYTNFIRELSDTTIDQHGNKNGRQWFYQTCSQFGYFQTCEKNTHCLFTARLALQYELIVCQQVFGIHPKMVQERINFTNTYYGADDPRGSRIVFVNGSIDPWHALSILKNVTSTQTAIFIPGTSHCQNMDESNYNDPPQLREARRIVAHCKNILV